MRHDTRRLRALGLAAAIGAAVCVMAAPASGDLLTVETFTGATVTDPAAWVAGGTGPVVDPGWPGKACLTAGTNIAQTPIAGCGLAAPDAAGSGALRLTPALGNGHAGFALYNKALPTTGGLDITFKQAQWAGSGGDGLSFFLVDGVTNLTQPGNSGGNLGYSSGGTAGVVNGLVGVGLDAFGNYSTALAAPLPASGCAAGTGAGSAGAGFQPNRAVVRGPGNGNVGYCYLGASPELSTLGLALHGPWATRAAGTIDVRVVFDPATVTARNVTVFLNGIQVVQVPAPTELLNATTFKFGFGSSTGAATNNHDVWDLAIDSVVPLNPVAPPAALPEPVLVTPSFTG